jgi:hypothetical protein
MMKKVFARFMPQRRGTRLTANRWGGHKLDGHKFKRKFNPLRVLDEIDRKPDYAPF